MIGPVRRAGIAAAAGAVVVAGAIAVGAAPGSELTQTKALFLQGRPVAGERFSAVIIYWTAQGVTIRTSSGGLCQASIRTRQGELQRRLGSGQANPVADDAPEFNVNVWSWKIPRTAAGKVFGVVCARLIARIDSTAAPPRVRLVKVLRPGYLHRWRIARG